MQASGSDRNDVGSGGACDVNESDRICFRIVRSHPLHEKSTCVGPKMMRKGNHSCVHSHLHSAEPQLEGTERYGAKRNRGHRPSLATRGAIQSRVPLAGAVHTDIKGQLL